jgi:hypothetical protein
VPGDLDSHIAQIASRGVDPVERETYSNGVRKVTYQDESVRVHAAFL